MASDQPSQRPNGFAPDDLILRWNSADGHAHSVSIDFIEFCRLAGGNIGPYLATTNDVGFYRRVTHPNMPIEHLAGFISQLVSTVFLEAHEETQEKAL